MKTFPINLNFDPTKPIGKVDLLEEAIPPHNAWHLDLGGFALSKEWNLRGECRVTKFELCEFGLVMDAATETWKPCSDCGRTIYWSGSIPEPPRCSACHETQISKTLASDETKIDYATVGRWLEHAKRCVNDAVVRAAAKVIDREFHPPFKPKTYTERVAEMRAEWEPKFSGPGITHEALLAFRSTMDSLQVAAFLLDSMTSHPNEIRELRDEIGRRP